MRLSGGWCSVLHSTHWFDLKGWFVDSFEQVYKANRTMTAMLFCSSICLLASCTPFSNCALPQWLFFLRIQFCCLLHTHSHNKMLIRKSNWLKVLPKATSSQLISIIFLNSGVNKKRSFVDSVKKKAPLVLKVKVSKDSLWIASSVMNVGVEKFSWIV